MKLICVYEPRVFLTDQTEGQNSGFLAIDTYLDNLEECVECVCSSKPIVETNYSELEKERHDDV